MLENHCTCVIAKKQIKGALVWRVVKIYSGPVFESCILSWMEEGPLDEKVWGREDVAIWVLICHVLSCHKLTLWTERSRGDMGEKTTSVLPVSSPKNQKNPSYNRTKTKLRVSRLWTDVYQSLHPHQKCVYPTAQQSHFLGVILR